MKEIIKGLITEALIKIGAPRVDFAVEHPANLDFGDYSTNVGIVTKRGEEILKHLEKNLPEEIEKVELKAGFINFYLSKNFFSNSLKEIIENDKTFGKNENLKGEKVMVEYTDPNPFKEFHIGHLMSNAIGESVSRLVEWNGAEVKRVCYQGDVGLHVAKAVWDRKVKALFMIRDIKDIASSYAEGSKLYDSSSTIKKEIDEVNKRIYDKKNEEINEIYELGKKISLEYFDKIYKKLGTKFDLPPIMESEAAPIGKKIVEENIGQVFEKSDGAIVFHAEKYDPKLHTRVFINSEGLPTYEAKDLGNAKLKYEKYPYTLSIVVTGNEIKEYFKVMQKAMELTLPELAAKTKHLPHGMLRLPTGKMSSRTGDVITAEALLEEIKKVINEKGQNATDDIAVGAIKYTILKQGIGNDIVFDFDKSISTEGDSGPYLQYTYARTNSLLEKAGVSKWQVDTGEGEVRLVEKLLYRFPEVVERAGEDYAPQLITTYLTELAGAFNNFYAQEQIINNDSESPHRLAITKAFNTVMRNGLTILGIPTPERV